MDSNILIAQKRRTRTILWLRLRSGIKDAVTKPWKGILVLSLCAAFIFLWNIRDKLVPFHSDIKLLSTVWGYIVSVFIPLIFLLLLMGLLSLLGTPFRAKAFEEILLQIGFADRHGHAPVLISCKRIKGTAVSVMSFYSLGVGMERWRNEIESILDAIDMHLVRPIRYGGKKGRNRNIIVITAAPGAETRREDTLYDEL
jgi:hypothetical protein